MGTDKVVVERISTSRRWWPNQQYGLVVIKNMPSPKGSVMFKTHNTCLLPVTYHLWVLSVKALNIQQMLLVLNWHEMYFMVPEKIWKPFSVLCSTQLWLLRELSKAHLSQKPAGLLCDVLWVASSDCFDSALYLARSGFLCTLWLSVINHSSWVLTLCKTQAEDLFLGCVQLTFK